jgi:bacterioferritin comigratory protein
MLEVKDKAPNFELEGRDGTVVQLSNFLGKKVVVYFYPKDNTPGCTRQACAFASAFQEYEDLGVKVIGISKDSLSSHNNFAQKYELPFILLSDPDRKAIEAFGVWQEKKMYGKVSMGVVRSTFLIDEEGYIEKIWKKAKPDTNAQDILDYLRGNGKN